LEVTFGMTDKIDTLLHRLRAHSPGNRLDTLEADVWSRIEARKADIFFGKTWQVQLLVTCGALLLGVFIAQMTGMSVMPEPLSSEIIVLSDDSAVAPSVILEGGL
jgi:hypothetical protein